MKQYKVGVVIGKFMPPHLGHEYLFNFASLYCDELFILVDNIQNQPILPNVRVSIIKELMPNANVLSFPKFMPQEPNEAENFWEMWKDSIEKLVNKKIDVLIAAMDYGFKLANVLGCSFVPIDIERNSIPISATQIRENPYKYWDFLTRPSKKLYTKKVCILGAESTGKTTAAKELAKQFNTLYVPEYAESIIARQGEFFEHNVKEFIHGQINSESALLKFANKVLISDSSVVTTLIWAEICFNSNIKNFASYALEQQYDLVLVFDYNDTTWEYDVHRDFIDKETDIVLSDVRNEYQEKLVNYLNWLNIPYTLVTGNYKEKIAKSRNHVYNLITN